MFRRMLDDDGDDAMRRLSDSSSFKFTAWVLDQTHGSVRIDCESKLFAPGQLSFDVKQ